MELERRMTIAELKRLVTDSQLKMLESAWMQAIEQNLSAAEMGPVLETLAKKGNADLAEMLGGLWLEELAKRNQSEPFLIAVKASLSAAPTCNEMRPKAAEAYRAVYAAKVPYFDSILQASGLLATQSPRRALRTMDTCLAIREGAYLANRFDHRVLRAGKYQEAMGEFELSDAAGDSLSMEPKALADEFEIVSETDFRVLQQHRADDLRELIAKDTAAVLIGVCQAHGGKIDNDTLKERLVPRYIGAGEWAAWWTKARNAAKRHPQLSLEGRSPVTITLHSAARTLEEELAPTMAAAKTPTAKLEVLQQYIRESRERKVDVHADFVKPVIESLAREISEYFHRRPSESLCASLAIVAASRMGLASDVQAPSPTEVIAKLEKPADAIAEIEDLSLWPDAMDALSARSDARTHLARLLLLAPTSQCDAVTERLRAAGGEEELDKAVADAWADPLDHLELALWLWKGPAQPPTNAPGRVELLSRILKGMVDLEHDWDVKPTHRKAVFARLRSGLSASGYSAFRAAVTQMSEAVAETIKRLIERAGTALAEAVREEMTAILKEAFFNIFVMREKVDPWADPSVVWTSEAALRRREGELKEIVEIKMLENARAIGAAAAHGDLSENSEWKFALEERDMLRARVAKMQEELGKARPIEPQDVSTASIGVGSRVTFNRVDTGAPFQMTFLGPWEGNLEKRIYSYQSQMAQELMGQPLDSIVRIRVEGFEGDYKVTKIEPAV